MKKSLAFLLCLIMILTAFSGCGNSETNMMDNNIGDEINVYMGEPIYNFDPAEAYKNQTAQKIIPLIFDNLFVLNDKGEVKKSLVDDYEIDKDANTMTIELKEDAYWSDGKQLTANDVMYTWQRLLDPSNSFEAASLLYDVKNAKAVKNAELTPDGSAITLDDVGFSALDTLKLQITFQNEQVDYDNFLIKLTSAALSPVREDVINRTAKPNDWAKSNVTIVSSGAFRLRKITYEEDLSNPNMPLYQQILLERNTYYFRDFSEDPINETVLPSKIIIKLKKADESIIDAYNAKTLLFLSDVPFTERSKHTLEQWKEIATITNALSTNMLILNQKAKINGVELFANANVRNALSLAIDRQKIAKELLFADPATGVVPNGVFEQNSDGKLFRENATASISTSVDTAKANTLLQQSNVVPANFAFAISVPAQDDVHVRIAELIAADWAKLGFKVTVNKVAAVDNKDKTLSTGDSLPGTKDDIFVENLSAGKFEVAIIDYVAFSADALSTLAPFAYGYAGTATNAPNSPEFNIMPHISGYNNKDYNAKIEAAFAESDAEKRAQLLHDAEAILIKDLPVIPVVFNKNVVLKNEALEDVEYDYYGTPNFIEAVIKENS